MSSKNKRVTDTTTCWHSRHSLTEQLIHNLPLVNGNALTSTLRPCGPGSLLSPFGLCTPSPDHFNRTATDWASCHLTDLAGTLLSVRPGPGDPPPAEVAIKHVLQNRNSVTSSLTYSPLKKFFFPGDVAIAKPIQNYEKSFINDFRYDGVLSVDMLGRLPGCVRQACALCTVLPCGEDDRHMRLLLRAKVLCAVSS